MDNQSVVVENDLGVTERPLDRKDVEGSYSELLADLYARWTLDPVIEIARAVSEDFVSRPEFYRGGEVPDAIVDLRMAYGTSRALPNRPQRHAINMPILGASDAYVTDSGEDKFRALRSPLFEASITYSERTIAQSIEGLRQRIRSALKLFRPHLGTFNGTSFRAGHQQIHAISDLAFTILRSPGVSQVFGINPPPDAEWPIGSSDPSGALLIRTIGEKLQLQPEYLFNEEKFQRLRRVAEQGRDGIETILQVDEGVDEETFDGLAMTIYTWAISLRDYRGN